MSVVDLQCGAATDVGRVRENNQDAFLAASPVFVVADGMGGHEGGEVASAIVVEEFTRLVVDGYDPARAPEAVTACLAESQRRIREYGDGHCGSGDSDWCAGTTVVTALLYEDIEGPKWLLANLGDSRVYRWHDRSLEQVSVDHSLVQELVDAGELAASAAASHPERHVVTRALGGPTTVDPDFFVLPLCSAPRLLLCSDGVSGMLSHDTLAGILRGAADPRDAADHIVHAAVAAGGRDNATAVVVDVVGLAEAGGGDTRTQPASLEEKLGALP